MGYVGVIICDIEGIVSGVSDLRSDGKVYFGYC